MKIIILAYLVYSTVTNWNVTYIGTNRLEIGEICEVERIEIPNVTTNISRTRSLEVFLARRATNEWWRGLFDEDDTLQRQRVTNFILPRGMIIYTNSSIYVK